MCKDTVEQIGTENGGSGRISLKYKLFLYSLFSPSPAPFALLLVTLFLVLLARGFTFFYFALLSTATSQFAILFSRCLLGEPTFSKMKIFTGVPSLALLAAPLSLFSCNAVATGELGGGGEPHPLCPPRLSISTNLCMLFFWADLAPRDTLLQPHQVFHREVEHQRRAERKRRCAQHSTGTDTGSAPITTGTVPYPMGNTTFPAGSGTGTITIPTVTITGTSTGEAAISTGAGSGAGAGAGAGEGVDEGPGSGLGLGTGSGTGSGSACPSQATVTITEDKTVTVTVTASGAGGAGVGAEATSTSTPSFTSEPAMTATTEAGVQTTSAAGHEGGVDGAASDHTTLSTKTKTKCKITRTRTAGVVKAT